MSAIQEAPSVATYRDEVTVLMEAGEPFGRVEGAIDEMVGVDEEAKAVLWLHAFAKLDSTVKASAALSHLADGPRRPDGARGNARKRTSGYDAWRTR